MRRLDVGSASPTIRTPNVPGWGGPTRSGRVPFDVGEDALDREHGRGGSQARTATLLGRRADPPKVRSSRKAHSPIVAPLSRRLGRTHRRLEPDRRPEAMRFAGLVIACG